ncbi:porin [Salmonella enterica]|nr:porin [Salmonella enterica]ECC8902130.1 porin [Salmonella enterica subsp. diarizonae]EDT4351412.1 porin [Salmonella enterica subsp. diarizonae serovar 50:k:z]EIQ3223177.1 porin [Salmonella enterica subsp. diarizonae serovar 50:k:z53]EAN5690624.1 porin [Salmonella enterica]
MKKRILIGIIVGTAMMSAQASNVYDNKEKGTKVDITGSLRLMLEDSSKRGRTDGDSDSKLKDEGSRVGVKYVQRLTQEVDAIGYFEYGGDTQKADDNFTFNNRQSYGGLKFKDIGELDFGRVTSPFDYVHRSDYSYEYGNSGALYYGGGKIARVGGGDNNYIKRVSNTIKFMSQSWNGLQAGATYTMQTGTNVNDIKDAWTMGIFYKSPWNLQINAGIGHQTTNGSTDANAKYGYSDVNSAKEDIWGIGMRYDIPEINLSVGLDYGGYQIKDGNEGEDDDYAPYPDKIKAKLYGIGAKWTYDQWGFYSVYGLRDGNEAADNYQETRTILGSDYAFNKLFKLWLEYTNLTASSDDPDDRVSDDKFALGLRYYF